MKAKEKQTQTPLTESPIEVEEPQSRPRPEKICVYCGGTADSGRFLNRQFRPLCREDYLTKTAGQIVARLRETDVAPNAE